jgi:hypothetical protein
MCALCWIDTQVAIVRLKYQESVRYGRAADRHADGRFNNQRLLRARRDSNP